MFLQEDRDHPSKSEAIVERDRCDLRNISTYGFFIKKKVILVPSYVDQFHVEEMLWKAFSGSRGYTCSPVHEFREIS